MRLAIVVPCFNEEASVSELALSLLLTIGPDDFMLFVDDGSTDRTTRWIRDWQQMTCEKMPGAFQLLMLSRNRGHQAALLAGLLAVKGRCDCAITMDADGQHPPSAIPDFIEQFRQGADIVYGVRRRNPSWASRFFYWLIGESLIPNHGDFRLISAKVLNTLAPDSEPFLRGLFAGMDMTVKTATVEYDEQPRIAGRPTYTLLKRISLFGSALKWRFR